MAVLVFVTGTAFAGSLDDGKIAFERKDWKTASSLLGRFVQDHPDDAQAPSAAFLRAVALYQLGDYRTSLDAFQKLERTWPHSAFLSRLPYWKGTAALAAGMGALAERELEAQAQFPQEEPFTSRALLNLALARISLGKSDEAVKALELFTKVSREADLLAQAWAVWGDEDRKKNRATEALDHFRRAWLAQPGGRWDLAARTQALDLSISLGRFAEAKTWIDEASAAFPAERDRWDVRRVPVYRGLGDDASLKQVLETLWSRDTDPRRKQDWAINRARLAEESKKPEALWWLRAAQGPDVVLAAPAILRYAFLLEQEANWSAAAQALEQWVKTKSSAAPASREEVLSRAAQDWVLANDPSQARKAWDRLVSGFPTSARMPGWLLGRGRVWLEAGDTVRALADFSRLLKSFPKAVEANEARYQTGLVYLKREEPVRAEAWFYEVISNVKSGDLYLRALLSRGVSFVNAGKIDLARGSLQRLIRESPQGPWTGQAWMALGRNALQARVFDEAAQAFGRAEETQRNREDRAQALWSQAEAWAAGRNTKEAAAAFGRYVADYNDQPRVSEAHYRRGLVFFSTQDWAQALDLWSETASTQKGTWLARTREGMAIALLRLGRVQQGWDELEKMESVVPDPEAWYRWGQVATAMGEPVWAVKAFEVLLQRHPSSAVAEAALPRAAGALLGGGKPDEALARYAEYFRKFGGQPSSAPVARAAAAAALPTPRLLESLVTASRTWGLSAPVAAEFSLAWAQSRLDSDTDRARSELQDLSRTAPWVGQRSEALAILGRWHLGRGNLAEARTALESAATLGDDLALFKARWALALVTEKEGDGVSAARQRESAERTAGPGVPLEFRLQVLQEAAEAWKRLGKPEEADRVKHRIEALNS